MKMAEYIQVFTAVEKEREAEKIAEILLEKGLAGCVQIARVESRYRWKGKIEKGREYLCIVKSRKSLYKKIEKVIKENHPYEVPEITAVDLSDGSADYLGWLEKETR